MPDNTLPSFDFEVNEDDPEYFTDREFELAMWAFSKALMSVDRISQQDPSLTIRSITHTIMADYWWSDRLLNEMVEQIRLAYTMGLRPGHWIIENGEWKNEHRDL